MGYGLVEDRSVNTEKDVKGRWRLETVCAPRYGEMEDVIIILGYRYS
jgi:hypothetical protein